MTPPDDRTPAEAYDELAAGYEDVEAGAYNAHLEFPGTTSLLPGVDGTRVLDAGCGAGRYTEWLLDRGADVVGVDASEAMLDRAADRVGGRATLHRGDLAEPLSFAADSEFDGVVSALALDYVADWEATFAEFERVLAPGGFLVFSVRHPVDEFDPDGDANYFETERRTADWAADAPYYRRPFSAMFDPLLDAGFRTDAVHEPQPTEAFAEQRPERYETESREPVFLCVRAVAP
ncbi:class I SAM-dependent methyltransferase [Halobacterium jilantaiense]|uniref:Methyltransferase domain-containing protein n=1 Tax=Halobacterium jilantaiense TaxID=355548 RepID=A0A1I0PWA5_9EURY|nr:class I SAM-dependent methyltransferase [Halobacterium jilantaiense]SEW18760.1 Methyltransferase domain-containing protein [Halobacterium jilantaiense]